MGGARYFLGAVGDFTPANGTEITGRIRFPNEDGFEETCDSANAGFSTIGIEDLAGDFTVQVWQPFWITEQDCTTDTRVYTGFISTLSYQRMSDAGLKAGPNARLITAELVDLNGAAKLRVIRGGSGKRPVEPTTTRVSWLLSDVLDGVVFDNGLLDVPVTNRDEADFRGNYAADVLSAMAQDGALDTYIIWDGTASPGEQFTLVIEPIDGAQRASTLSLSNVLADTTSTPTTVFPPDDSAVLTRDGSEVYSGVLLRYTDGEIYRTRAATDSTYFGATYGRDWVEDEQRIGRTATAQDVATTLLEKHSIPVDTISCKVILPTSKVNLIRAGMTLPVKFSHFPGYSSYVTTKVKKRNVRELGHDTTSRYELTLELSVGISVSGGNGPGAGGTPLPPPTPTTPAIVQTGLCHPATSGFGGEPSYVAVYLPSAPTAGNLVIAAAVIREGTSITVDSGWTVLGSARPIGVGGEAAFRAILAYRTVSGGDTGTYRFSQNITNVSYRSNAIEVSGVSASSPTAVVYNDQHGTSAQMSVADAGGITVSLHMIDWVNTLGTPGGFTQDCSGLSSNGANIAPKMMFGHAFGGSDSTMSIGEGGADWGGVIATFSASTSGASANPPRTGQDVFFEHVAAGDGSTSTFTTDWPFASGSLHVYVDRIDQTGAVVAQNGASGSFQLSFAPKAGEVVEASYEGR